MAEYIGKSLEELEKEITCGICQEHYTEPKILPCQHYYCKNCVFRLVTRTATGQPFSCPECRSKVILPEGGVAELKTAFNINRLKAIVLTMEEAHSKEDPKNEESPIIIKPGHIKENLPSVICVKHKEPPIIYCFNCESLICQHCTLQDHHDHNFEFCKISAPTMREKLLKKLEPLKIQKEVLKQALLIIQNTRQEIQAQGEEVATKIQNFFKELRDIFERCEQELLQEATGIVQKKIEKLSAQEESLSVASEEVQSVVTMK